MSILSRATGGLIFGLVLAACNAGKAEDTGAQPTGQPSSTATNRVSVVVDTRGYTPSTVEAKAGEPITLVFTRTADVGCAEDVVFPDHSLRRALPLNEEVAVTLTPKKDETIAFTCGMGMYHGSIVAAP